MLLVVEFQGQNSKAVICHFHSVTLILIPYNIWTFLSSRNNSLLHRCCTLGSSNSPSYDELFHLLQFQLQIKHWYDLTLSRQCTYIHRKQPKLFIDKKFLSRTQLLMLNHLQDFSTRRSLSTTYRSLYRIIDCSKLYIHTCMHKVSRVACTCMYMNRCKFFGK